MDCEKAYFYLTKNFKPNYETDFLLIKGDIYKHITTGMLYKKRLLFDFGFGQEIGYVCYPEPTFDQLITLIEYVPRRIKHNPFYFFSKNLCYLNELCTNNWLGAISLIMQEHVDELIVFLEQKVETDYFENTIICKRFRRFIFDRERAKEFGILAGGTVETKTYETIFQEHAKWKAISNKVIKQVYKG